MTSEQQRRLEALPGWSFDLAVDRHWERAYEALAAYSAEHGHLRGAGADDLDLGGWAARQRSQYRAGNLEPDRARRLEQITGWSWDPKADAWETGYEALRSFADREGHALVPRDHREDGYPLGAWVGEQRARADTLPAPRRRKLEAMAGWSFAPHEDRWDRTFRLLAQFVAREGHAAVPTGHVEDGVELGAWVIRHRLDHKHGRVPGHRAARLAALPGWVWDTRVARWEAHYQALRVYAAQHAHARVPSSYEQDGVRLGAWVVAQRAARRRGDLAHGRARRLEDVPGWTWDARRAPRNHPTLF